MTNIKIVYNSFFHTLQNEFSKDKQAWLIFGLLPVTPEQTPSRIPDITDTYHSRKPLKLCTMPATPTM